jgi:hypothetical protein
MGKKIGIHALVPNYRFSGPEPNPVHPEYEAGMLTT